MKKLAVRFGLLLGLIFLASALIPVPASAGAVTFTVTVKSAYLRSGPSLQSPRVNSVFKGQTFAILGRTADSAWVRLDFAGAASEAWILAAYGAVAGDLNSVPVTAATPAATTTPVAPDQPAPPAGNSAATGATLRFTLSAKSTYLRSAPQKDATRIGSAFKGQVFTAIGRSVTNQWIQIMDGGTTGWVAAGVGQLSGALATLPITDGAALATNATSATAGAGTPTTPLGVPVITPKMRQVYAQTAQHGNKPLAFATVGDCNSESYIYLELIASGIFDVRPYGSHLQETIGQFYPSFLRKSVAVKGGFNAASMFDPLWANPAQCHSDEGPFACELRVTKASIVFIALGTGDHLIWRDFEQNYRRLIEYALDHGVLPVLVTKADDLEATTSDAESGYINAVIRRLGTEYEVPVMDFDLATQNAYNHGLQKKDFHLNVDGIDAHVLLTVQTLDAIWRK